MTEDKGNMKTKIKKTFVFFVTTLLPLSWVWGFTYAMLYKNEKVESSLFLYMSIRVALIFPVAMLIGHMDDKEIKGWYSVASIIASLGVMLLCTWIYIQ